MWQYNLNLINGQCRNHLSQIQTKPALDNFKENNDKKQQYKDGFLDLLLC